MMYDVKIMINCLFMVILFAYSLVRKLAVSAASRPNRVRK